MNRWELVRARWTAGEAWFDARTERERVQLGFATAAAILTLWLVLFHQPIAARHADATAGAESASFEADRVEREIAALGAAGTRDARSQQRDEVVRLEREIAELAARATAAGSSVLPPREVVALLRELLAAQPDLRLVRIESLAAEPIDAPGGDPDTQPMKATLYRHPIEIEIEGEYLPTLRWLGAVAALPWRLQWDELRYDVTEHPRARIVLRLHTLGREQEWIRA